MSARLVSLSNQEIGPLNLLADAEAGGLDAVEEREQPALEDLADVDVAQLAVEPAQQALGLAGVLVVVAAGDLLERLAAAGDAEPDRPGESPGSGRGSGSRPTGSTRSRSTRRYAPYAEQLRSKARPADQLHRRIAAVRPRVWLWHLACRIRPITFTRSRYRPSWRK